MFKKLAERLVNDAMQIGIVKQEDFEDYVYGLSSFINTFVNILSAVVLAVIVNALVEIILFLVVFQSLRKFVGGSHSKTPLRCYISTFITYIIVLAVIRYYPFGNNITTIAMIISSAVMFVFAPVEAVKKPLDDKERKVFGMIGRILVVVWLAAYVVLDYIIMTGLCRYCALIIAVSSATVAVSVITGKINLHYHKSKS